MSNNRTTALLISFWIGRAACYIFILFPIVKFSVESKYELRIGVQNKGGRKIEKKPKFRF